MLPVNCLQLTYKLLNAKHEIGKYCGLRKLTMHNNKFPTLTYSMQIFGSFGHIIILEIYGIFIRFNRSSMSNKIWFLRRKAETRARRKNIFKDRFLNFTWNPLPVIPNFMASTSSTDNEHH